MKRDRISGVAALAWFATSGCGICSTTTVAQLHSIIDGAVARASAVYGIKVDYDYRGEVRQEGKTLQNEERSLSLTMFGADWILRHVNSNNFRMSRNLVSLNYYEASSKPGQLDRSLLVQEVKSMEDLIHEHASHAATRLGTVWFQPQSRYMDQHRKQCRQRPSEEIDGRDTHVLEWTVPATDFDEAMIVIPRPIAVEGSGILRIYASEELNWALPRIEYCTLDGVVKRRFNSTDFAEASEGLFFPRRASSERLMGNRQDISEFTVHKVSHVNAQLPEKEFALRVPLKTRVRDARPGMATAIFSLREPGQLDNVLRSIGQSSEYGSSSNRKRLRLLVINIAVVLVCAGYWVFRRCRS